MTLPVTTPKGSQGAAAAYPLDHNGYVPVSRPPLRIPAAEVQPGDVLIADGYITTVSNVRRLFVSPVAGQGEGRWYALHITGHTNIVRFPHETVTVVRP